MPKENSGTEVTTIALLSRKEGMSKSLFSCYWRDVHGVLAARIPGFDSYVQYHLDAPVNLSSPASTRKAAHFDGIAEVVFKNEMRRAGLNNSEVAALIHEDERNVFQKSLLFNLQHGASSTHIDRVAHHSNPKSDPLKAKQLFLLIEQHADISAADTVRVIEQSLIPALARMPSMLFLRAHVLLTGNPGEWQPPGVDHTPSNDSACIMAINIVHTDQNALMACLGKQTAGEEAGSHPGIGNVWMYPIQDAYHMVAEGLPTELGLRGLSVQQTIEAVGAENQRQAAVLRTLYGTSSCHQ